MKSKVIKKYSKFNNTKKSIQLKTKNIIEKYKNNKKYETLTKKFIGGGFDESIKSADFTFKHYKNKINFTMLNKKDLFITMIDHMIKYVKANTNDSKARIKELKTIGEYILFLSELHNYLKEPKKFDSLSKKDKAIVLIYCIKYNSDITVEFFIMYLTHDLIDYLKEDIETILRNSRKCFDYYEFMRKIDPIKFNKPENIKKTNAFQHMTKLIEYGTPFTLKILGPHLSEYNSDDKYAKLKDLKELAQNKLKDSYTLFLSLDEKEMFFTYDSYISVKQNFIEIIETLIEDIEERNKGIANTTQPLVNTQQRYKSANTQLSRPISANTPQIHVSEQSNAPISVSEQSNAQIPVSEQSKLDTGMKKLVENESSANVSSPNQSLYRVLVPRPVQVTDPVPRPVPVQVPVQVPVTEPVAEPVIDPEIYRKYALKVWDIYLPGRAFPDWVYDENNWKYYRFKDTRAYFYDDGTFSEHEALKYAIELTIQREPCNMGMIGYYDTKEMETEFGWETGAYEKSNKDRLMPNIAIYCKAELKFIYNTMPTDKYQVMSNVNDVHVINLCGFAFDSKKQPDYEYFNNLYKSSNNNSNVVLEKLIEKYSGMWSLLYATVMNLNQDNPGAIKTIQYVRIFNVGGSAFSRLLYIFNITNFIKQVFLPSFSEIEEKLKAAKVKILGFDFGTNIFTSIDEYKIPEGILDKDSEICKNTLYVNAWDPWSLIGNGNKTDGTLDGYWGRSSNMSVLGWGVTNPHIKFTKVSNFGNEIKIENFDDKIEPIKKKVLLELTKGKLINP
jgi:hypothetical protein